MELLVAMAIFAIVGALALSGYTELQRQSEYAEQRLERMREVQRAVQTHRPGPRAARAAADPRAARRDARCRRCSPATRSEYRLEFTRAGWSNTAGLPRPTLQRVGYRLDQDGLWRDHWPVLDRTLALEPVRAKLLGGVRSRALPLHERRAANGSSAGRRRGGAPDADDRARPAAVEVDARPRGLGRDPPRRSRWRDDAARRHGGGSAAWR